MDRLEVCLLDRLGLGGGSASALTEVDAPMVVVLVVAAVVVGGTAPI